MRVLKHTPKTFPGVTSLFVTIAVAMLLIVIIAGVAAFSIREQRQASNTEQSNRALQTAEAGINDAAQTLSSNPTVNVPTCTSTGPDASTIPPQAQPFADQANEQITCRTVTSKFTSIEGALERDKATQIQILSPNTSSAANSMQLRWHSDKLDKTLSQYYFNGAFYPATAGYNNAAAIELTFIYWERGNLQESFLNSPVGNNNGLRIATVFIMPGQADKSPAYASGVTSGCENQPNTSSAQFGDYRCVTNPNNQYGFDLKQALNLQNAANLYDYVVRIKTRYTDTHFQARFFDTSHNEIAVQSTKALIDVTAKSSNLYRRVQAEKPVIPTSLENLFDSVLYAGRGSDDQSSKGICKTLVIDSNNALINPNDRSCENN